MMQAMSRRHISSLLGGIGLLLAFALAPAVFPSRLFRVAIGDLTPLLLIAVAAILSSRNAFDSRGHTRLFWSLITAGLVMWCFNQGCWAWFEVVLGKPVPDPFEGDIVLFLHVVPMIAAVAIRPHQADEREGMLPSALNVIILLVWWIVVYAFFVFPEEYIVAKLEQRIIEVAKYVITAKSETNRVSGRVDKSLVSVPEYKYDHETRLAAAKALNEKTGSFKGWADDAKGELNGQLKKQVEEALNISHFKDFKVSLLSRPLREWYQQQQEILQLLPLPPATPPAK